MYQPNQPRTLSPGITRNLYLMSKIFWKDVIAVSIVYKDVVKGNKWATLLVRQWIDMKGFWIYFHSVHPMPAQAKSCFCKPSCTKILNPKQSPCHCQLLMSSSLHSYLSLRPPLHAYIRSSYLKWSHFIINRSNTSWMHIISTTNCFLTRTILDSLRIHWPPQMHSYQHSAEEQFKINKYFAEVCHWPWSHRSNLTRYHGPLGKDLHSQWQDMIKQCCKRRPS